jgi:hypothetical protein
MTNHVSVKSVKPELLRYVKSKMETNEETYRNFQRRVDRLCSLIVASNCTEREIDIERLHLRIQAVRLFPEKMQLYDLIYESRFCRLREQFRTDSQVSAYRIEALGNLPSQEFAEKLRTGASACPTKAWRSRERRSET